MYTGIVTHRGLIVRVEDREGGCRRLLLRPEPALEEVDLGASIAVDGVCLTVAEIGSEGLAFDVMPETLRKTTLGRREASDVVNVERPLRVGDEMGGHMVQGHVEGVGEIVGVERLGEDVRISISVDAGLFRGMIPKGSVALDGVSLTVGEVWQEDGDGDGGRFSVYLIPHTLSVTGFGRSEVGDPINVEPDVMGRMVELYVRRILGTADDEDDGPPKWRTT